MEYQSRQEGEHAVVSFQGELDLACLRQARDAILAQLQANRPVLVDLSGVEYIDSSGVACLVEGYQQAQARGLGFGLVSVSEPVMRVLELARLTGVLPIHDSVAAGLEADT